jgi:hypothetical protein
MLPLFREMAGGAEVTGPGRVLRESAQVRQDTPGTRHEDSEQSFPGCLPILVFERFYRHAGFVGMSKISPFFLEFPKIL